MDRFARLAASFAIAVLCCGSHAAGPGAGGAPKAIALAQGPAPWTALARDEGAVEDALPLTNLTLLLRRPPELQQAFEEFLRAQQDPGSPEFHHWLEPAELGARFGLPQADIEAVSSWLESQGLHVDGVSNSRTRIQFRGTAGAVGAAFHSALHAYALKDATRIAAAAAPAVPAEIAGHVLAVHGLATIEDRPHEVTTDAVQAFEPGPDSTICTNSGAGTCTHYIWPGDFSAIYDVSTAYQQGLMGAGQTVAVIGRSAVYVPDIENFQRRANLAVRDPVVIVPASGIDPGPPASTDPISKDQSEATLDVTRVAGVAPAATIDLIVSKSTATVSGIGIAVQYAVDANPLPARIMTISFGACESDAGQSGVAFYDELFSQAAAEGISVFVSSGDSGIAGCDAHHVAPPAGAQVASPNYICASSHATCVGGTQFADTASPNSYWRTTNSAGFTSAIGYIPEGAWNEPLDASGNLQVAATGGGVSAFVPTPHWQTVPGVPGVAGRYTPDVSLSSAAHDGYVKCQAASGGSCESESTGGFHFIVSSGTSAATPSMAGIAALLNQKMGGPQGNLNPGLYSLAARAVAGVFHDVTIATSGVQGCDPATPSPCNNSTAGADALTGGLAGYTVGPGFDLATGLGSVDVGSLVAHWASTPDTSLPVAKYQGLWWASPAGSESGWGINFAHQGDTIFATWFTYDLNGNGNWLVMTAPRTGSGAYAGTLYTTTGPPFNAAPFNPAQVSATAVGNATLSFSGASDGTFAYTIGSTTQTKQITREAFSALPTCATATSSLALATNYTDLWWAAPAGSESGWGVNFAHEGSTIFLSWFTYDTNGKPMWLVATAAKAVTGNSYSGSLYRTTGPAFNSVPFPAGSIVATQVGSATVTFADGNNATFAYTVNGISQTKAITRELFGGTATLCH